VRGGRQLEAEIGHSGFILADFVPPATADSLPKGRFQSR
jgi:hypothetical protein